MEGAAQTLVSNVGQLVGVEFRQLRGVGGEVARLRSQLATINALLRMQSEADESAVDHFVREWMKQLREVGYDAEDCVDLYLFRVRTRPGDHILLRCKRLVTTLWSRRRLANDIRDLRAHASDINEQHASYGVSLEPLRRPLAAAASAEGGHVHVQRASSMVALRPAGNAGEPDPQDHLAGKKAAGSTDTDLAANSGGEPDDRQDHIVGDDKAPATDLIASTSSSGGDAGDEPEQDHLVGVKARATELANKVKELKVKDNNEKDLQLKVFSIVGFGGLGKTTLAVEVCRQLQTEFPCQAQVSVSQTFSVNDVPGLLKSMLRQIARSKKAGTEQADSSLGDIDAKTVGELKEALEKSLDGTRYLILIDDVWSISAWDVIWSNLPKSICGSRIIVTTRIETVAKACSIANDIHQMKKLDEEESKKLFVSKAFVSGGTCPQDLEGAMTSILKKCGGLPLAIVSIASLLASYKVPEGKEMWETVQKSIGSQMESNPTLEGMREILTLSYTHLPHHLKTCMLYLSIFPEDHSIAKDRLIKRWIAEGLIAEKRGLTKMDVAEVYFNELMSKSMIEWADGKEETCRVHDMMLEILVSKSLEANFVSLVGGQYEGMSYTNTIRRLSIHGGAQVEAHSKSSSTKSTVALRRGTHNSIKGTMMEHVRSLSIFDPEADKLLARLGEFTLLRVLDLEDCKGLEEKHMSYICRMYLLRFLSLKGTDIKAMPSRVGDLEHLQTLDVRRTRLQDFPKTLTRLEKLEHLLFSNKENFWFGLTLPRGINKMKALRQLNKVTVIRDPEVAKEIGDLYQLQELAIYVNTKKSAKMDQHKVPEELSCSLSKLYSLRWLDIGNLDCRQWPFVSIMDFLHNVDPPPRLLRYLRICGCMNSMPDWVGSLNDLVEIHISWTYLTCVDLFNALCKLPSLKRLSLEGYFIEIGENMMASKSQPLNELKELNLGYSPETPTQYIFEDGCMPKLETLVVYFGDQWKHVVGIENLKNLKEVQYTGNRINMEAEANSIKKLIDEGKVSKTVNLKVHYFEDDK